VYFIGAWLTENLDKDYGNRHMLSNIEATIKALETYQINSKLVWDWYQSLMKLAKRNRVQLIWVLGHSYLEGNQAANEVARLGSECPLIGPEPACGISTEIAKNAVRDWTKTTKILGILNRPQNR
jgi:hypothetical protein